MTQQLEKFGLRWLTIGDKRKNARHHCQGWYPPGLQWWSLVIAVLFCWAFIAVLQYNLQQSQTHGGVIFAPKINDLPLRRSFWYLYLPTIIVVIFSILVTWIDHDAKRYEPYRQLSQPGGKLAMNSVLLHYPFDFAPIVPILAAKRRHWLVFWASFAAVLTTFGIVPLQAGIFSTKLVTQVYSQDFAISKDFVHSSIQERVLTLSYMYSVYSILELNGTLPAFTTRNYTLKPFTALNHTPSAKESWTANSVLYSMDLRCETAQAAGARNHTSVEEKLVQVATNTTVLRNMTFSTTREAGFNNSAGCYLSHAQLNNNTNGALIESQSSLRFRKFSASYKGYFTPLYAATSRGWGSLIEEPFCGVLGNRTFFAAFTQNKETELGPAQDITAIFCQPFYYEQDVEATVNAITGEPKNISLIGTRRQISAEIFNTTVFEESLASGIRTVQTRGNSLPLSSLPKYLESLYDTDLTPSAAPPIMTTVMSVSKYRFQELLDSGKLASAYELIYQLLFAHAMTEILKPNSSTATTAKTTGLRQMEMEAVVLEPIFTYLVGSLLALVSVAVIALMYIGYTEHRNRKLVDDPASMAYAMSMVADNTDLLTRFEDLDCASTQYFHQKVHASSYRLGNGTLNHCITSVDLGSELQQPLLQTTPTEGHNRTQLLKPRRPKEFDAITGIPFISLFIALMIALAVLFAKSQPYGLPLPSEDRVVQNLISEYLPTAIATLIEPMWIIVNRLLCVLQPLEQMRGSRAAEPQTMTLKYGSLPPQLTLFKAAQAGHFLLAAVCAMSLLANLLATTFAGLFFSTTLLLPRSALFLPPFEAKFVNINGSSGPSISERLFLGSTYGPTLSGAYQETNGEDHFLFLESNLTRDTSLPSWTDEKAMYIPFKNSESTGSAAGSMYQARTKYFRAEPRCTPLLFGKDYHIQLWSGDRIPTFNVTVSTSDGRQATCYGTDGNQFATNYGYASRWDTQDGATLCREGRMAAEMATTLQPNINATSREQAICRSAVAIGWMRTTQDYCDSPYDFQNRRRQIRTDPSVKPSVAPPGYEDAASNNTFFMLCQPEMRIGEATVLVDSTGLLKEPAKDVIANQDQAPQALDKYFSNGAADLISQSNLFIFRSLEPLWHNDTFASEFIHYFINRAEGSLRLTDPSKPLPTFADVEAPMKKAYTRLFAIWLGVNKEFLFLPATNTPTAQVPGTIITPEERLLFVAPLFVISECILSIYIIVSIIVYLRRPGRYLARMPTTIAAVIALFAASAAVRDLQGTSHMTNKEREKHLKDLGCRYGYGSYVGNDGGVHVGVEKVPFVRYMKDFSFEGSRAEREMRKRTATGPSVLSATEATN